ERNPERFQKSDIGLANDNVRAQNRFEQLVEEHGLPEARKQFEQLKFERWAKGKRRDTSQAAAIQDAAYTETAKARETALKQEQNAEFGTQKQALAQQQERVDKRLASKGLRRIIRDVLGRTKRDVALKETVQAERGKIYHTENAQNAELRQALAAERARLLEEQRVEQAKLERGISAARTRREGQDWESQAKAFKSRYKSPAPSQEARRADQQQIKAAKRQGSKDAGSDRARKTRTKWADQKARFYRRLEESRGMLNDTPDKDGVRRDFVNARKNEQDQEPER
ncbi:MAG: hypothetical protein AAFR27_10080, partial [Pseudomonadota bacterium]